MITSLLLAAALAGGACTYDCKVRIHACPADKSQPCYSADVIPNWTGLCAYMMNGVSVEWQKQHPDAKFQSAECVPRDNDVL